MTFFPSPRSRGEDQGDGRRYTPTFAIVPPLIPTFYP